MLTGGIAMKQIETSVSLSLHLELRWPVVLQWSKLKLCTCDTQYENYGWPVVLQWSKLKHLNWRLNVCCWRLTGGIAMKQIETGIYLSMSTHIQTLTGGIAMKQIETTLDDIPPNRSWPVVLQWSKLKRTAPLPSTHWKLTGGIAMKQIETLHRSPRWQSATWLTGGIAMKQIETKLLLPIVEPKCWPVVLQWSKLKQTLPPPSGTNSKLTGGIAMKQIETAIN